jgi:hypothetical protein
MFFFYLLVALAALVMALFVLSLRSAWRRRRALPFTLDAPLFSPQEIAFLAVLDEAVGADYRVFGKVRLSDLVSPTRRTGKQLLEQARARIAPLKIDFLVCGRESAKPVCAVGLIGRKGRAGRGSDQALARACDAVGLPLLRVPVADSYSARALAEQIYTSVYAPKVVAPTARLGSRSAVDELSPAEEEQALSVLAASIREGEPLPRPTAS